MKLSFAQLRENFEKIHSVQGRGYLDRNSNDDYSLPSVQALWMQTVQREWDARNRSEVYFALTKDDPNPEKTFENSLTTLVTQRNAIRARAKQEIAMNNGPLILAQLRKDFEEKHCQNPDLAEKREDGSYRLLPTALAWTKYLTDAGYGDGVNTNIHAGLSEQKASGGTPARHALEQLSAEAGGRNPIVYNNLCLEIIQEDAVCRESDGCPTETVVLKRFWRGQPIGEEHFPQWYKDFLKSVTTGPEMKHITSPNELEAGLNYWLVPKFDDVVKKPPEQYWLDPQYSMLEKPQIEECRMTPSEQGSSWLYFTTGRIWCMPFNNQAMKRWDIFGPVPDRPLPDFKGMMERSKNE